MAEGRRFQVGYENFLMGDNWNSYSENWMAEIIELTIYQSRQFGTRNCEGI